MNEFALYLLLCPRLVVFLLLCMCSVLFFCVCFSSSDVEFEKINTHFRDFHSHFDPQFVVLYIFYGVFCIKHKGLS
jgi:hypothetical protein